MVLIFPLFSVPLIAYLHRNKYHCSVAVFSCQWSELPQLHFWFIFCPSHLKDQSNANINIIFVHLLIHYAMDKLSFFTNVILRNVFKEHFLINPMRLATELVFMRPEWQEVHVRNEVWRFLEKVVYNIT